MNLRDKSMNSQIHRPYNVWVGRQIQIITVLTLQQQFVWARTVPYSIPVDRLAVLVFDFVHMTFRTERLG